MHVYLSYLLVCQWKQCSRFGKLSTRARKTPPALFCIATWLLRAIAPSSPPHRENPAYRPVPELFRCAVNGLTTTACVHPPPPRTRSTKQEKQAFEQERARLKAEIAKDKAERKARGGKLSTKLGVDGYKPAAAQGVYGGPSATGGAGAEGAAPADAAGPSEEQQVGHMGLLLSVCDCLTGGGLVFGVPPVFLLTQRPSE